MLYGKYLKRVQQNSTMVRTEFVVQEMRYFTTDFESFDQIDYYSSNTGCALFFSLTNATRGECCSYERKGTGGQLRRVRERRGRVWGQRSVEVTYCNTVPVTQLRFVGTTGLGCWLRVRERPWRSCESEYTHGG